jgi:Tol biopolymer transport system component
MAVRPGIRVGPYEVVALVGAGGMGEVWRARDTRLARDVAIKVLPAEFAADPDRLRRFEQEARAVAALDHPNILALYDVGTHECSPYIVTQLLEGETLRERLSGGAMPVRKAVEAAVQIAQGLAAAHEKGIVHRDLKPGNVFITKDGHVKILDFGLAKLAPPRTPEERARASTVMEATDAGIVLGTVGYMSPEQVLGKPLDARSDLFSLGVLLYEMLSGTRPFQKDSAPETMAAILKEEPPDLSEIGKSIPPGLARIVRHCLEKEPSSRSQSAHDVGFDLESLSQSTTTGTAPIRAVRGRRRLAFVAGGIAVMALCGAGLFLWGQRSGRSPQPSFKRITFRRGVADSACFTPDYKSVVYTAAFEGRPSELFVQRLATADARPLGVRAWRVVGTSGGDVAFLRDDGTLAQLPIEGGTPRDLLKDVTDARWDASRKQFAVVRTVDGRQRLEYPVGNVLLETKGFEQVWQPRVFPDGKQVAFIFQPTGANDMVGDVCVVDLSGRKRTLSKGWLACLLLSLSPDGREVWFSASRGGLQLELHAVTLSGEERLVARLPGSLRIQDVAPDGSALVSFGPGLRWELRGRMAGDAAERDLNWLDGTCIPTLAPDGSQMVFQEYGEGGGLLSTAYHWRMGGPPPTRLGNGAPMDVSPDWTKALVIVGNGEEAELSLVPIGAGETVKLPRGPIHQIILGLWHPDGKRIFIVGTDAENQRRLFVQDVAGGVPRPLAPVVTGVQQPLTPLVMVGGFTPDGRFLTVLTKAGGPWALYPIEGSEMKTIPHLKAGEVPVVFADDGRSLYVRDDPGAFPVHVARLDLVTGTREPWLELVPPDLTAVTGPMIGLVWLTPNGRFYAYAYARRPLDLFLVEGLK